VRGVDVIDKHLRKMRSLRDAMSSLGRGRRGARLTGPPPKAQSHSGHEDDKSPLIEVPSSPDIEAPVVQGRQLACEGVHAAITCCVVTNPNVGRSSALPLPAEVRANMDVESLAKWRDAHKDDDDLPGNLYRYWAVGHFLQDVTSVHGTREDREGVGCTYGCVRFWGGLIVMAIQFFGPPAILWWVYWRTDLSNLQLGLRFGHVETSEEFITCALGFLLFSCMVLNGIIVVRNERKSMEQLGHLLNVTDHLGTRASIKWWWLWIDAFLNGWVVILSSVAMFFLLEIETTPKDVLFDALSLTFLYNLDDAGGDMGFLDKGWDSHLYGSLCSALATNPKQNTVPSNSSKSRPTGGPEGLLVLAQLILWLTLICGGFVFIFTFGVDNLVDDAMSLDSKLAELGHQVQVLNSLRLPP